MSCTYNTSKNWPQLSIKTHALANQPKKMAVVLMGRLLSVRPGKSSSAAILMSRKTGKVCQAGRDIPIKTPMPQKSRHTWRISCRQSGKTGWTLGAWSAFLVCHLYFLQKFIQLFGCICPHDTFASKCAYRTSHGVCLTFTKLFF